MSDTEPQSKEMRQLLDRMHRGDRAATDELFRKVCGRLERLARKMLRGFPNVRRWEDSDDVMQNALMRLLRSLQKLKPDSMRAFYGLAAHEIRRELIDLARHYYGPQGPGANHESLSAEDSSSPGLDPPDKAPETKELDRWYRFHQAVEKLPTEHREVVSLIFYHGWTQAQVAELFQRTERTIRRRWHEALVKLGASLKGDLPA